MRKVWISTFGLAFLCSGALVMADEKPAETPPAQRGERPQFNREEFLKRFDKNGNGRIDEDERAAIQAELGDQAPGRRGEGRRGEGEPRPEGQAGQRPGRGPGQPGQQGNRPGFNREELLKQYDKDGNGELDEKEREAMQADLQKQREEREAEFKKTFDKDGDGALNAEEEAAYNKAVEERRSRFGNRRPGAEGQPGQPGRRPGAEGQPGRRPGAEGNRGERPNRPNRPE